jgi:hypothetical protein
MAQCINLYINIRLIRVVTAYDRVSISDGGRNCSLRSSELEAIGYRCYFSVVMRPEPKATIQLHLVRQLKNASPSFYVLV